MKFSEGTISAVADLIESMDGMDCADIAETVLASVETFVTPVAPLRELAKGWGEEADLCFAEKYVKELREVIDRG